MSNRYLNTIVSFDEVMEYYGLKDNADYYTVIREQIMNEIFDGYICSNYAKLSKMIIRQLLIMLQCYIEV